MLTDPARRAGPTPEDQAFRLLAGLTGVVFLASAALAAGVARAHMLGLGTVCGAGNAPHCVWCFAAASLGVAGLAAFAVATRRFSRPAQARIRARG